MPVAIGFRALKPDVSTILRIYKVKFGIPPPTATKRIHTFSTRRSRDGTKGAKAGRVGQATLKDEVTEARLGVSTTLYGWFGQAIAGVHASGGE